MMSDREFTIANKILAKTLIQEYDRIKLPALADTLKFKKTYILENDGQPWEQTQKSQLIESFIINFPVPPIVLYEVSYHNYRVIDGKQRLKAIRDFYDNKLVLTGLEVATELNGCSVNNMPSLVRDRLNHRSLALISILPSWNATTEEIEELLKVLKNRYG